MRQYSEVICNTVISDWLNGEPVMVSNNLQSGKPVLNKKGRPIARKGGWCKVYKCEIGGKTKALRLWLNELEEKEMAERSKAVSEYIATHPSKYLLNFEYIPQGYTFEGEIYPVILMDWCQGRSLKQFISDCVEENDTESILTVARQFLEMTDELHKLGISHGDLQHDNILITEDGLKLVDYDSMYVPALEGYTEIIKGKPGYQHPTARYENQYLQPYTDYFSELMIFLTLYLVGHKPELWDPDQVNDDGKEDQLLFKITEVGDGEQNELCDKNIRGVSWLFGELKTSLIAADLKSLSPLSDIVYAANIYPNKPHVASTPKTRVVPAADLPDNLFE